MPTYRQVVIGDIQNSQIVSTPDLYYSGGPFADMNGALNWLGTYFILGGYYDRNIIETEFYIYPVDSNGQYIKIDATGSSIYIIAAFLHNGNIVLQADTLGDAMTGGAHSFEQFYYCFYVDDEHLQGYADIGYIQYNQRGASYQSLFAYASNFIDSSYSASFYTFLNGITPPITYNWQSVPAITGKNGILSLSMVTDDRILTGDSISRIELADMSESVSARFAVLQQNLPNNVPIPVIYAGLVDNLTITMKYDGYMNKYELYLNVNAIYTIEGNLSSSSLGFIIDNENEVAKIVYYTPIREAGILVAYSMTVPTQTETEMHNIWLWLFTHTDPEDNPEINEGNEGTDPDYQPDIAVTGITKPSYGAIDTGFTKMYRMSDTQLKALSSFLWSSSFIDNVKKFFNDPREIIVGLSIMPVLPTTGSSEEVSAGGISTGVYGLPLTDQYAGPDVYGTCEVKAEKGNFLDFEPFTKVTAHLPFVGSHSLNVSDVMGKTLTLKYIFDFISGSCVAEIDVDGNPHYFFGGSCGIQIPTSSEDFGRMYSSILSAGATIGSTLATIATGGLTAPLAIGAGVNMLSNGMNASPTVDFASGSGSINGMIGCKSAFLTIERAKEKIVGEQQKYLGRPSYMTRTLSNCSGYTKCMSVHLDNVPCTETERAEIERLLTSGVRIVNNGSPTPEYTPTSATDHGLIFLKCISDTDVMGKSWDSEDIQTVEGKLLYEQSFLKPVFVVEGNYTAYNYCYIPEFGRFYYITDWIAKTGSIMEIRMQADVLQSWKTQIKTNKAVIERSAKESNNNAYFVDSMYWTQADKEVKTVPFTKADGDELVFEIPEDNYILTIAGGS